MIPVFLYGAGGHGRSTFEVIHRQQRFEVTAVLDDGLEPGSSFREVPVIGGRESLESIEPRRGIVTIGDNDERERIVELLRDAGLSFVTAVDPGAHVARDVALGDGTVVMAGVVVNTGTTVGEHVILNTASTVDHDCRLGAFAHLSPGVHVSGECQIGRSAHVGIGASLIQQIRVGGHARVGAGAAVIEDVPDGAVVAGVPARVLDSAALR
jgi:acetyltransferase EpsM